MFITTNIFNNKIKHYFKELLDAESLPNGEGYTADDYQIIIDSFERSYTKEARGCYLTNLVDAMQLQGADQNLIDEVINFTDELELYRKNPKKWTEGDHSYLMWEAFTN